MCRVADAQQLHIRYAPGLCVHKRAFRPSQWGWGQMFLLWASGRGEAGGGYCSPGPHFPAGGGSGPRAMVNITPGCL